MGIIEVLNVSHLRSDYLWFNLELKNTYSIERRPCCSQEHNIQVQASLDIMVGGFVSIVPKWAMYLEENRICG